MSNRRKFIKGGVLANFWGNYFQKSPYPTVKKTHSTNAFPMVISTWAHGLAANEAAMEVLLKGGAAIDAVEAGVRIPEADPESMSVGYGGLPDREGHVTLDACIMDHTGNCGS